MSTAAPRSVPDLIDAAAADENLTPLEGSVLVDYYLTNNELPDDRRTLDLVVDVGEKQYLFRLRRLLWTETQDHELRVINAATGAADRYALMSWHCARAMQSPNLASALAAVRARARAEGPEALRAAPATTAEFLQRMFARQSGTLIDMGTLVLAHSKLIGRDTVREMSEADAAKAQVEVESESRKEMEAAGN